MKSNNTRRARFAQVLFWISNLFAESGAPGIRCKLNGALLSLFRLAAVILLAALASGAAFAQKDDPGYPEDWTHHHIVISDPGSVQDALVSGSYYKWRDVVSDPRFDMQRKKRSIGAKPVGDPGDFVGSDAHERRGGGPAIEKDWSSALLSGAVQPDAFPAKWSFSTTTASCANDYVVYPTGAAGSATTASIVAFYNLYAGGCTGTVPSIYWAYDTGGTVSTSPVLSFDGKQVAFMQVSGTQAFVAVVKGLAPPGGVTGSTTNGSKTVTITAGTITAADVGMIIAGGGIPANDTIASITGSPATSITLTTAATATNATEALNLSDGAVAVPIVIGPTAQAASGCTTTIASPTVTCTTAAFTNAADLGAGITGTDIPAGATITVVNSATSINISIDPTVHTTVGTATISAFNAFFVTPANYKACTAPCMTAVPLGAVGANDTFSSPFYLYGTDTLYVGDDSGNLHKYSGIFNGTPAEVTTSWPVVLNAANKATSPVYDFGTGFVLVGDTGGFLYGVGSGNSGTTSGSIHGTSSALGGPIIDGPLVDPTAGMAYVFVTTNSGANNAVFQFKTNFTTGTGNGAATGTTVGTGGTVAQQYYLYSGTFDNVYYQSAAHTGNLWVLGNTSTAGGGTLYQIPINANVMAATSTAAVALNARRQPWPSPITEFCANGTSACVSNGTNTTTGTDYLFFSVNHANVGGCTNASRNGCVLAYNVSTPATPIISGTGLNVTNVASPGCWATSGIIIDNSVVAGTLAGASQIYFINFNGHTAGGSNGNTSVTCTSAVAATIDATQALQSSP
jgi:hypothetical protein